jgi:hypothetical protein
MSVRLKSLNLAPFMASLVAWLIFSMWLHYRPRTVDWGRIPVDISVGVVFVAMALQTARGPRITYASVHPAIAPPLIITIIAAYVFAALEIGRRVVTLWRG